MDSEIQIITDFHATANYGEDIKISQLYNYDSVDSYKYNIIDLKNPQLWHYEISTHKFVNSNNLTTLIKAINDNDHKSNFIIMLPKNLKFKKESFSTTETWLKNEREIIERFLYTYFNFSDIELIYGENETKLQNQTFEAGFHIKTNTSNYKILTENTNGKVTTIKYENLIFTTLQLTTQEKVITFIENTLLEKKIKAPDWFEEIEMFDDEKQKKLISKNKSQINELNSKIDVANEKLRINNEYKSILYTNGKYLEKTVLKILGELLNEDLSKFIDEKREDFLIKCDNVTFVGEIKGVNSNLKNKHLAQLNINLEKRRDEVGGENLKPLMIINRFKEYPPEKRKPIDNEQIKLAIEKYEHTLIITVENLLKLFEQFKEEKITSNEIIEKFNEEEGLFEL